METSREDRSLPDLYHSSEGNLGTVFFYTHVLVCTTFERIFAKSNTSLMCKTILCIFFKKIKKVLAFYFYLYYNGECCDKTYDDVGDCYS